MKWNKKWNKKRSKWQNDKNDKWQMTKKVGKGWKCKIWKKKKKKNEKTRMKKNQNQTIYDFFPRCLHRFYGNYHYPLLLMIINYIVFPWFEIFPLGHEVDRKRGNDERNAHPNARMSKKLSFKCPIIPLMYFY